MSIIYKHNIGVLLEKSEDIKGVIRGSISKDRLHNGQKKRTKGQTSIDNTLHRKLKIEQHEPPPPPPPPLNTH